MMNEPVKMEDPFPPPSSNYSTFHLDHYDTTTFLTHDLESSSDHELGFMELLSMPHFTPTSTSLLHPPLSFSSNQDQLLNTPPTPNSSSISSQSNDKDLLLDGDEPQPQPQLQDDDDDQLQNNNSTKQLKPVKKAIQKRKREPRFAFMTKSEVDHLEDGYRWRKYGQKAVKNSAFPRSYYRCTSASCNVKKRVERCWNDPSVVVTTYEGQHTHPSPVMHRSSAAAAWQPPLPIPTLEMPMSMPQGFLFNPQQQPPPHHTLTHHHGLLQDVVPSSLIIKKEYKK